MILQEIWREGCDWDERIPLDLATRWRRFILELQSIDKLEIPRQYCSMAPSKSEVMLVIFVDASEDAFSAVGYFRMTDGCAVEVALVMGKAKVAPIKKLSVPQLELQAAVLGVRLATAIKNYHDFTIHCTRYLSDSSVTLSWISSRTFKFKTFVAVRVGEILESSSVSEWAKVSTKENVTDDATKPNEPSLGVGESRWFKGAAFLKHNVEEWPVTPARIFEEDENEVKRAPAMIHTDTHQEIPALSFTNTFKAKFQSNWRSLVHAVASVLRFRDATRGVRREESRFINPLEWTKAENLIFKEIQSAAFPQEKNDLVSGNQNVSKTSQLVTFCPYLDSDGVVRMKSRAQKINSTTRVKDLPILPNKHLIVDTFIQHHHDRNLHMSEESTIADIRESAWIIAVRVAVRRVKSNCQICKINRAKPQMPLMGELPLARLDFGVKPFTYVGIDAFGPYSVKINRSTAKRYGIIFTCLTYRAVYLEILMDLSTSSCLSDIRAILTRRGPSVQFFSDNGKNFVGSRNQLIKDIAEMSEARGQDVADRHKIDWKFIPAYSPWMGGAWERLIQSIKKTMDYLMTEATPRENELRDVLMEAEFLMNRRPLTHMPISHEDDPPLTPNTVMFGEANEERALAPGIFSERDLIGPKSYRRVQYLTEKFASRWLREYLPGITRRSKWFKNTKPVEVGDIVILVETQEPKNAWKRGRIVKTHPGADGVIREADVKLSNGSVKTHRSVGRLAVLDLKT